MTRSNTSGSIVNNFRYTGREWDPETSLYYYRARYYDPNSGRFVNEDPARFVGGMNFFSYVHDSPSTYRDPFGLWTLQVGASVNGTMWGGTGSLFAGLVIDS